MSIRNFDNNLRSYSNHKLYHSRNITVDGIPATRNGTTAADGIIAATAADYALIDKSGVLKRNAHYGIGAGAVLIY